MVYSCHVHVCARVCALVSAMLTSLLERGALEEVVVVVVVVVDADHTKTQCTERGRDREHHSHGHGHKVTTPSQTAVQTGPSVELVVTGTNREVAKVEVIKNVERC